MWGTPGVVHMLGVLILYFENFKAIFEIESRILFTKFKNRV